MAAIALLTLTLFCFAIAFLQNVKFTHISMEGWIQFLTLTKCNLYQFFSLSTPTCNTLYQDVSRDWALLILYILRTIAIALLLSVIVVKLLSHKDLFVMRPTLCLAPANESDLENPPEKQYWEKSGGWELRCRLYNGTRLTLLNLNFIAKLRRPKIREGDWSLINRTINLLPMTWAIALPFVPLSIRIPLDKDDLDMEKSTESKLILKQVQSHSFLDELNEANNNAKSFLVINIEGTIDDSDGHLMESLWWPIDDRSGWYSQGREKPINVPPGNKPLSTGGKPQSWKGWEDFEDGVIENYVFGYGSLMDEWLKDEDCLIANLEGYERNWQATMDNETEIPGYKIYEPINGEEKPKNVSFLNIGNSKKKNSVVTGVVKKYTLKMLADLDRRERNYLRVDITDQIIFLELGKSTPPQRPYTIWTYIASAAAQKRHQSNNGECIVATDYFNNFESAVEVIKDHNTNPVTINFEVDGNIKPQKLNRRYVK
ncbi:MAG: gamma-glutamylcyclotransferase [Candidatus Thiodiazotropha sp. (ex Semelilucina semeliformis)]|nr:gamma-glutamylcyclotransferase [Candidatus Thiodiazotropha sp. (ex Semelilucina semeliformis)]